MFKPVWNWATDIKIINKIRLQPSSTWENMAIATFQVGTLQVIFLTIFVPNIMAIYPIAPIALWIYSWKTSCTRVQMKCLSHFCLLAQLISDSPLIFLIKLKHLLFEGSSKSTTTIKKTKNILTVKREAYFTHSAPLVGKRKLIKGQGRFFYFLYQLYSNTDLINAYLHIHTSTKSVLNNIWPFWKQQGCVHIWKQLISSFSRGSEVQKKCNVTIRYVNIDSTGSSDTMTSTSSRIKTNIDGRKLQFVSPRSVVRI